MPNRILIFNNYTASEFMLELNMQHLQIISNMFANSSQSKFMIEFLEKGGVVEILKTKDEIYSAIDMLRLLTPQKFYGQKLVRIGGNADGGYVMVDPLENGIAYSIGVSPMSPWDTEMANRGFMVHQYDASIDKEPDEHPNIFFNKVFLADEPMDGPFKTMKEIIRDNKHQLKNDIILQIDIEGAEWDVFKKLSKKELLKFKQIVIEFHDVGLSAYKYSILKKIRETHTPVHFHYNNNVNKIKLISHLGFIYSDSLIEVSYIRNDNLKFSPNEDYYPTPLDRKNTSRFSRDIPIGHFFD